MDFQSEHERYLVEKHFNKPVIIFDYPLSKAFYMRLNDDKLSLWMFFFQVLEKLSVDLREKKE